MGVETLGERLPISRCPGLKVKECKLNGVWNMELLISLVGVQKVGENFQFLSHQKEGEDLLVWMAKEEGVFIKSA